jgi:hypothetical protein
MRKHLAADQQLGNYIPGFHKTARLLARVCPDYESFHTAFTTTLKQEGRYTRPLEEFKEHFLNVWELYKR